MLDRCFLYVQDSLEVPDSQVRLGHKVTLDQMDFRAREGYPDYQACLVLLDFRAPSDSRDLLASKAVPDFQASYAI